MDLILCLSLWYFHFIFIIIFFHITHITCDVHPYFISLLLLTWHYLYFTLSGGFQHIIACRVVTSFPISPYECSSNILVWDIVLLVRIQVTSIYRESLPIWLCIFIGVCLVLIMVCKKKKKRIVCMFIVWFYVEHMYVYGNLLCPCVAKSSSVSSPRPSFHLILPWYPFLDRVWATWLMWEVSDLSLGCLNNSIHYSNYLWCGLFPCFDVGWLVLTFLFH